MYRIQFNILQTLIRQCQRKTGPHDTDLL